MDIAIMCSLYLNDLVTELELSTVYIQHNTQMMDNVCH